MKGTGVERTPDGRHIVVNGRRWRASDPAIPEELRAELVSELMAARRLVRSDPARARPRVHDAKVALGERGEPWWEPSERGRRERLEAVVRALLRHRGGAGVRASEAARAVGGERWRELMPAAGRVAAELARRGEAGLRERGEDPVLLPPERAEER